MADYAMNFAGVARPNFVVGFVDGGECPSELFLRH